MADREYMTSQTFSTTIGGNVYNVSAKLGGGNDHDGNIAIGGTLTVGGSSLTVTNGTTTLNGDLDVTGDGVSNGDMTVAGTLDVEGIADFTSQITFSDGAGVYFGAGSPESSVAAAIGSIYLRTDGGAGTSVYFKQSGAGNTGWGTMTWNGFTPIDAPVETDVMISPLSLKLPAANAPTQSAWGSLLVYSFDSAGSEYIHGSMQLPHSFADGTQLTPHVHFVPATGMSDGETVVWRFTYRLGNIDSVFAAEATVDVTYTASGNIDAYTMCIAEGSSIGSSLEISSVFYTRLERLSSGTFSGDAYLISVDVHHQVDKLGTEV